MVMEFFRKAEPGIDHIQRRVITMLGDARHSFDLATDALLSATPAEAVADDIRATDDRINLAEQELRSELVVHVSVRGAFDIGVVLGYTLLIKKIERIGDQAKNILDLVEEGADFTDAADLDELLALRRTVSELFGEVGELLGETDVENIQDCRNRADQLRYDCESKVRECMHSDRPGHEVVPRAIFYRYLKRIVANLAGVLTSATEPIQHQDYQDSGSTDITDD